MNLAILFYDSLKSTGREVPFSLSDSLLIMLLHDIEKPFKQAAKEQTGAAFRHGLLYESTQLEDKHGVKNRDNIKKFKEKLFKQYKFKLTPEHKNALEYVEGEGNDYNPNKRVTNELGAFCHMCDYWSARGWYDFPKAKDKWSS